VYSLDAKNGAMHATKIDSAEEAGVDWTGIERVEYSKIPIFYMKDGRTLGYGQYKETDF